MYAVSPANHSTVVWLVWGWSEQSTWPRRWKPVYKTGTDRQTLSDFTQQASGAAVFSIFDGVPAS